MRRRLALLVVATTSLVLLAFLIPLAVLIDRAAADSAVAAAAARSQQVVQVVATYERAAEVAFAVRTLDDPDFTVTVRLADGELVGRSPAELTPPSADLTATEVSTRRDGRVTLDQPVIRDDGTAIVSTWISAAALNRGVRRAWVVLALLGLVLIGLSLLVADRLARSMTRPVTALALTAERLGRGDLDARVDPAGPDEIRDVGVALNRLATRIRQLLVAEREAVADLSHRLRTPVTALALDAEGLRDPDERARLMADVDELSRQVDAVIREARRPVREGAVPGCDARAVVADRLAFWRVLADDQSRTLVAELPDQPLPVRATEADLAAMLDALLGNVFAHTAEGVGMAVALVAHAGGVVEIILRDQGAGFIGGVAPGRGESGSGSTGLGLDIARRTAIASGGDLAVRASPGGGAEVTVRLGPAT